MSKFVKTAIASTTLLVALLAGAQPTSPATSPAGGSVTPSVSGAAAAAPGEQENEFARKHPRIHEVNQRLHNERERIQADLKAGKITEPQAHKLAAQARKIHQEEMRDARKQDGHLTKQEQEHLNREETRLNASITSDVKSNAQANGKK